MKANQLVKVLTTIGIGVLSMGLLVGCGAKKAEQPAETVAPATEKETPKTEEKDYIVMGTNAEFEPFEYRDGSDVVGFDVEIAKAVAAKMGKELKIEDMEFGSLIVALNNSQIDFIAAGMSVTPEREQQVDFSDKYFKSKQVIIVKADNNEITTADNLVGKKVGVQLGTTGDLFVSMTDGIEVISFDKAPLAVMDLQAGKVDAVVIDAEPAKKLVEGQADIKVIDAPFVEEEYAIAVRKGDSELLTAINETIKEMKENGEYDKALATFFTN